MNCKRVVKKQFESFQVKRGDDVDDDEDVDGDDDDDDDDGGGDGDDDGDNDSSAGKLGEGGYQGYNVAWNTGTGFMVKGDKHIIEHNLGLDEHDGR